MLGLGCGRLISERFQKTLMMACAVAVIFLGLTGTVKEMLALDGGGLALVGTNCMLASLIGGALIGEAINIEDRMEKFGIWLRRKTGSSGDTRFVDGFVTASLTVCIGAMAIVGAIEDGLTGDWSILATKAVLDLIIVMVMTCSLGKGCIFSAVPVFAFEGVITFLASAIKPLMTDGALSGLSLIGSVLIFCVGLNLIWGKKVRVANLLPAVLFAAAAGILFPGIF